MKLVLSKCGSQRGRGGLSIAVLVLLASYASAITEGEILLIENGQSDISISTATLYRSYHPGVNTCRLTDPDTPTEEVIGRDDYQTYVRDPIMAHLTEAGLWDTVQVIVTTKGVPLKVSEYVTSDRN